MTKKNLTIFANYCRDRNIRVTCTGCNETIAYFTVRLPRDFTQRKQRNFESRIRADSPDCAIDILYKRTGHQDCNITLPPTATAALAGEAGVQFLGGGH